MHFHYKIAIDATVARNNRQRAESEFWNIEHDTSSTASDTLMAN